MPPKGRGGPSKGGSRGKGGEGAKGGPRGRSVTVRLRTAKGRKTSSTRWLQRQLNDPYVLEAQRRGYRSRAAFKLCELDDKYKFLKPGKRIVDLGAAPGGWTQVAVERVRPGLGGGGRVLAVDINEMEPIVGAETLLLDFLAEAAPGLLHAALEGPADVVLSDMAAPSTGHSPTDHMRIMALCEAALQFAEEVLAPGGVFVAKVLRGGAERDLLDSMKRHFAQVRHVKPKASRSDSAEIYVVAIGFRLNRDAG